MISAMLVREFLTQKQNCNHASTTVVIGLVGITGLRKAEKIAVTMFVVRLNVKVLITAFFDCNGGVHHEFLRQGLTVNKEYYLEVMR